METTEFERRLAKALNKLYDVDKELLDEQFNINERTVTHRLALHLTPCFSEYDVDCEYNRMIEKNGIFTEGDFWAKTLALSPPPGSSAGDDEAITVYPDIIIHKRKTGKNLAVIEIKMKWKNGKKDFDLIKLKAYHEELNYQFAIYLELGEKLADSTSTSL
jgi:hypothetical protein